MDDELDAVEEPEILRAKYSQKERDAMPLEDFGDPDNRAFPIKEAEDVIHAAERLHNASGNQAAIKKRIIKIAKRKGFPLPQTWQDEEDGKGKEKRSMDTDNNVEERNDATKPNVSVYLPIVSRNDEDWTVTGQATVEDIDSYGTIFDYEASKKAFKKWFGNVREMHDSKKAVGRGIDVQYDDENKRILVTTRVSKGAKDTWEKIKDGTLQGYSVGAYAGKEDWSTVTRNGKDVPLLKNYKLVELSLVDNPATPDCFFQVVRADGFANGEVVAADEPVEATQDTTDTRAGAKISHVTQGTLHDMRDSHLLNAKKTMQLCDCEECQGGVSVLDPDNDGDIDILPSLDYDGDGGTQDMLAKYRAFEANLERTLKPFEVQMRSFMAAMTANNGKSHASQGVDFTKIEERLNAIETRAASIAEVRADLSAVKGLVERIAATPQQGGPITNPQAMEKLLAGNAGVSQNGKNPLDDEIADIRAALQRGLIDAQTAQIRIAAAQIKRSVPGFPQVVM